MRDFETIIGQRRATIVARITKAWNASTDSQRESGAQWYGETQSMARELSAETGYSLETVAAVIAHLSPRLHWARNVKAATEVLNGIYPHAVLSACADRAIDAMNSSNPLATVKGSKTKAFASNILGYGEFVTIDVWMLKAIGVNEQTLNKSGAYAELSACFVQVANRIGISPSTLQATIWVSIRGRSH